MWRLAVWVASEMRAAQQPCCIQQWNPGETVSKADCAATSSSDHLQCGIPPRFTKTHFMLKCHIENDIESQNRWLSRAACFSRSVDWQNLMGKRTGQHLLSDGHM